MVKWQISPKFNFESYQATILAPYFTTLGQFERGNGREEICLTIDFRFCASTFTWQTRPEDLNLIENLDTDQDLHNN